MTAQHSTATVIDISALRVACKDCSLFQLCLPLGIGDEDLERLEQIIKRRRPVKRGEYLFRNGDAFHSIYAVKSGSIKTFTFTEDGREQVTGFHLPGELFGLDAINSGSHCCSAVALERSSVCEIPFDRLEELGKTVPSLLNQMLRIMSKEIQQDRTLLHLGKKSADERLAGFLWSIARRLWERGFDGSEYRLSMSRNDIGNYLGLAVETVSRLFTQFQAEGLLTARAKQIQIHDLDRLRALAGANCCNSTTPAQR
jgi:CRP/FNR family transcriptional regulator